MRRSESMLHARQAALMRRIVVRGAHFARDISQNSRGRYGVRLTDAMFEIRRLNLRVDRLLDNATDVGQLKKW